MTQTEDMTTFRWLFDVGGTELAVIYPIPNQVLAQAETDVALANSIPEVATSAARQAVKTNRPDLRGKPITFVSRTEITGDAFARIAEDASDATARDDR